MRHTYYERNKEKLSRRAKEYYYSNKPKILEKLKNMSAKRRHKKHIYNKKYRQENAEQISKQKRRYRSRYKGESGYRVTKAKYEEMLLAQNGMCAICHTPEGPVRLNVDHCHTSGKVRGLLCKACNFALGLLKDDVNHIERAAQYLKTSRAA